MKRGLRFTKILILLALIGSGGCGASFFTIGGTVTGLSGTLVIQNNDGEDLTIEENGDFTFDTSVKNKGTYDVTVLTQPSGGSCTVADGSGTVNGSNITDVTITCVENDTSPSYTLGGTVTGLTETLVIQNNETDDLTLAENGSFVFSTELRRGSSYDVTILTQPLSQTCTTSSNNEGTIGESDVGNITITCLSGVVSLSNLTLSWSSLSPEFNSGVTSYLLPENYLEALSQNFSIRVTPTTTDPNATVTVNGTALASGTASPAITLTTGANNLTIRVTGEDGQATLDYVVSLRISNLQQTHYVKASNPRNSDAFGVTIDVDGDWMAVGNLSKVYVFSRSGASWTERAILQSSNYNPNDTFNTVALSGNTLLVGAQGESSNATGVNGNEADDSADRSGAAYVFVWNGVTWSQQAYLKASNTGANDFFGASVAIDGNTIVVGAYQEDSDATGINGNEANNVAGGSGAAYVFVRSGTTWSQQAYLKASNTEAGDNFGQGVEISGETIVVGAPQEDSNATGVNGNGADNSTANSGAAYVFVRNGTTWTQQAYLKASNTGASDTFGWVTVISGDTIGVNAMNEDSNATGINGNEADNSTANSGAAYVFVRNGTTWTQQAYLKASNTETGDRFGAGLSLSGNLLAVGSDFEGSNAVGVNGDQTNNNTAESGAVYLFRRSGTTWSQEAYFKASNTNAGDAFGAYLAISSDALVIGARREDSTTTGINGDQSDNSLSNSGAAYIFE